MYGSVLRAARHASGLTQAALATIAGVDQPNISAMENDRRQPSLDTLQRLLAGCGRAIVAVGPGAPILIPHPDDDDFGVDDTAPTGRRPLPPDEANRVLTAALDVAEAIVRARQGR